MNNLDAVKANQRGELPKLTRPDDLLTENERLRAALDLLAACEAAENFIQQLDAAWTFEDKLSAELELRAAIKKARGEA